MPAMKRNRLPNRVAWRSREFSIGLPNGISVGLGTGVRKPYETSGTRSIVPQIYPGQRSPLSRHLDTPVYEIWPTIFDPWFARRIPGNCNPRLCFLDESARVTNAMSIGLRSMPLALCPKSVPAHRSFQAFLPNLVGGLQASPHLSCQRE